MTPTTFLLAGIGIGLATAAPVGPVNILAISTALKRGRAAALGVGAGAIVADTLIAAVAAFGVTAVIDFVEGHEATIALVGAAVLAAFGILTMMRHPHLQDAEASALTAGVKRRILAPFLMTVTNPGALLGMLALVGALKAMAGDAGQPPDFADAAATVIGVAIGGSAWWTAVAFGVAAIKDRLDDRLLDRINRGAGLLLILAGAALAVRTVLAMT